MINPRAVLILAMYLQRGVHGGGVTASLGGARGSGGIENRPSRYSSKPADCPVVYVYDSPGLWDFPMPISALRSSDPAAVVGHSCGDGFFVTNQFTMAILVLYRLSGSTRCRLTSDPNNADLLLVPAFPKPKRKYEIMQMCQNRRGRNLEKYLPHLTSNNSHRHVLLLSKGHISMDPCKWWRSPDGLLAHAQRIAYSVVVRGPWNNNRSHSKVVKSLEGSSWHGPYGPYDDTRHWPLKRLASRQNMDRSDVLYPHTVSVPYPSGVHWDKGRSVSAPWARLDRERKYLVSFLGDLHGQYGLEVRKRIVDICSSKEAIRSLSCLLAGTGSNGVPSGPQQANKGTRHIKRSGTGRSSRSEILKRICKFRKFKEDAIFCLEPGGDSPFRKSLSDDIALGCIPVVFSYYLELVNPWHWNHFRNDSHVYIDRQDFISGTIDLFAVLRGLVESGEARRMQETIATHGHAFQYSLNDYPGDAVERLLSGANKEAIRREKMW
eukprot:CAMPEP_0177767924 /NCGR_PEP_ID=MMETSP0491_2-20121128/9422_1 /TAXON_ID=63592 /ORGANISM="Tetraselmis chuii, Strain PLY429" /LENGTH=492 /DNA_ID=CAMNT_0019284647 /DNA_START=91 /DNA_END=1566 /DNA_ORIENTATION=-